MAGGRAVVGSLALSIPSCAGAPPKWRTVWAQGMLLSARAVSSELGPHAREREHTWDSSRQPRLACHGSWLGDSGHVHWVWRSWGDMRPGPCAESGQESTPRGFEPLRAEPNGFLVHHLSHSVTVSLQLLIMDPSKCGLAPGPPLRTRNKPRKP